MGSTQKMNFKIVQLLIPGWRDVTPGTLHGSTMNEIYIIIIMEKIKFRKNRKNKKDREKEKEGKERGEKRKGDTKKKNIVKGCLHLTVLESLSCKIKSKPFCMPFKVFHRVFRLAHWYFQYTSPDSWNFDMDQKYHLILSYSTTMFIFSPQPGIFPITSPHHTLSMF